MVIAKTQRIKLRHLVDREQRIEFLFPLVEPRGVFHGHIPPFISWTHMAFQRCNVCLFLAAKFTIGAIAYSVSFAMIPNKPPFVIGDLPHAFCIVRTAPSSITRRPGFFQVIICIGTHTPVVAVSTHFCIYIKVIKQHKFIYQFMLIGRVIFSKKHQAAVSVSSGHIS